MCLAVMKHGKLAGLRAHGMRVRLGWIGKPSQRPEWVGRGWGIDRPGVTASLIAKWQ